MELTLRDVIEDTLDGVENWREVNVKELAALLEERIEGWLGNEDDEEDLGSEEEHGQEDY